MLQKFKSLEKIPFVEHPILDYSQAEAGKFDITSKDLNIPVNFIINNEFSQLHYCIALANKLCILPQSELAGFFDYQCLMVMDPFTWLNKVEKLIAVNIDTFEANGGKSRIHKLYTLIQDRRNLFDPKRSHETFYKNLLEPALVAEKKVSFDFETIKRELLKMNTFEEKVTFLIERRADYLQNEYLYYRRKNEKPLDELIDIEIDKLERIKEYKQRQPASYSEMPVNVTNKIKINGQINVLVDVFYQFLFETDFNGMPYLDSNISDMARMICDVFVDQSGEPLSYNTVRTILSPTRPDKRPKESKRIKIQPVD